MSFERIFGAAIALALAWSGIRALRRRLPTTLDGPSLLEKSIPPRDYQALFGGFVQIILAIVIAGVFVF